MVGVGLTSGEDELAIVYLAAVQSLAYQTRQIVEAMQAAGHPTIGHVFVRPLDAKDVSSSPGCIRSPRTPAGDDPVRSGSGSGDHSLGRVRPCARSAAA